MMEFKSAMLPINLKDGLYLDASTALDFGEALVGEYCFAEPFRILLLIISYLLSLLKNYSRTF